MQSFAINSICTRISLMMSLMNNKKNNGPRTQPCGMPDFTEAWHEHKHVIDKHWLLGERYASIHDNSEFFSMGFNFNKIFSCETWSNVFWNSKQIISICLCLSKAKVKSSIFSRRGNRWHALLETVLSLVTLLRCKKILHVFTNNVFQHPWTGTQ